MTYDIINSIFMYSKKNYDLCFVIHKDIQMYMQDVGILQICQFLLVYPQFFVYIC